MKTSIPTKNVKALLNKRINSLFILENDDVERIEEAWESALARAEKCFTRVQNNYYYNEVGMVTFNPLSWLSRDYILYLLSSENFHRGRRAV